MGVVVVVVVRWEIRLVGVVAVVVRWERHVVVVVAVAIYAKRLHQAELREGRIGSIGRHRQTYHESYYSQ